MTNKKNIFCQIALILVLFINISKAQDSPESIRALADSVIYLDESHIDAFLKYSKIIETKSRKINYLRGICDSYRLMGIYHECRAEYAKAIEWHLKNLAFSEQNNEQESQLSALSDLSNQYFYIKQYKNAKFYTKKAILIGEKNKAKPKKISSFYLNLGIFYNDTHQPDSALIFYNKSLSIKQSIHDSAGIANLNINISKLLINAGKYQQAQPYIDYNLAFHKKKKDEVNLCHDYMNQALNFMGLKKYNAAKKYLDNALFIAKKIDSKQKEGGIYSIYSKYYQEIKDFKKAFQSSQNELKINAEILNAETNQKVIEIQEKYYTEKRENENKLHTLEINSQKKGKQNLAIIIGLVALLAFLAGFAWWKNQKKKELLTFQNHELEAKKDYLEKTLERLHFMQEQLIQSEKMASIGQLTAGIAHEINNPINFVANNVQALKMDLVDLQALIPEDLQKNDALKDVNSEIQELMKSIERGVDRTRDIVLGLRTFARNDEGEFFDLDLHDCIDSALSLLTHETKNRVEIIKNYGNIPTINGHSGKLNQVFLNLISNSIHAINSIYSEKTLKKGRIEIYTKRLFDNIEISIKDNGCGMNEATKKRIFEPFFTTKPVGVGTGLGLSICYGIIQQHHGKIEVESKVGVGSTFVLTLPI